MKSIYVLLSLILITSCRRRRPFSINSETPISPRIVTSFEESQADEDAETGSGDEATDTQFSADTVNAFKQISAVNPQINSDYFLAIVKALVMSELKNPGNVTCLTEDLKKIQDKLPKIPKRKSSREYSFGQHHSLPEEVDMGKLEDDFENFTVSASYPVLPPLNPHPHEQAHNSNELPQLRKQNQKQVQISSLQPTEAMDMAENVKDERHAWSLNPVANDQASLELPIASRNSRPISHGSLGGYSWTIERAPTDLGDMEAILPPETIYNAISKAEQNEKKQSQRLSSSNDYQYQPNKLHHRIQGSKTRNDQQDGHAHFDSNHYSPEHQSSGHGYRSTTTKSPRHEHSSNHYNQGESYPSQSHGSYPDPESSYPSQSHGWYPESPNSDQHGPEYYIQPNSDVYSPPNNDHHHHITHHLMSKAKKYLHKLLRHGSHTAKRHTKKLFEISITILALLAFAGYIAALLFQALVPSLLFPLVPGIVNVNVTNPGLLGVLFGRRGDKNDENLILLDDAEMNALEQRVKRALHKVNTTMLE